MITTFVYNGFIDVNKAPADAVSIGLYNKRGGRLGGFSVGALAATGLGTRLYSFGAISDTHLGEAYPTSDEDTRRALRYFLKAGADFVVHCGDCTAYGSDYECALWKSLKENGEFHTLPIYEITGNHDARPLSANAKLDDDRCRKYFGHDLFYTVEKGDDVFLFLGMNTWDDTGSGDTQAFAEKDLRALHAALEANRNKRCFLFEHCFHWNGSGNAMQSYGYDLLDGSHGKLLFDLLRHYENTVFFHGHSHLVFDTQAQDATANYDRLLGVHSVHIPSATQPKRLRGGVSETIEEGAVSERSEGYLVDVYPNHIVLNGVNFVTGKQVPIATYCLDTALRAVAADSFRDETGILLAY